MTPQEKAKELVDKMQLDWGCNCCHNDWAKECALIAVHEMIKVAYFLADHKIYDYLHEVKQEIEKYEK
jgi:hypothetical protein